ncbi:MAG: class I SAM-dependent methyltransferase [Bacteroidota bacterium]
MDILGKALLDYQNGKYTRDITTFSTIEEKGTLPLPYLFRSFDKMPKLERQALKLCSGKVLDIGCGAGSHALYLQEKGLSVTGLDHSAGAIQVCQQRGLTHTIQTDFLSYSGEAFDTLLLLMNGIGLAGTLQALPEFLAHCKTLLRPNGQVLLDSSNLIYMFEQDEDGGYWIPGDIAYYGEVRFQMEYMGKKGLVFDWLYLDYVTLANYAEAKKFECELISEGEHYDYLARLRLP